MLCVRTANVYIHSQQSNWNSFLVKNFYIIFNVFVHKTVGKCSSNSQRKRHLVEYTFWSRRRKEKKIFFQIKRKNWNQRTYTGTRAKRFIMFLFVAVSFCVEHLLRCIGQRCLGCQHIYMKERKKNFKMSETFSTHLFVCRLRERRWLEKCFFFSLLFASSFFVWKKRRAQTHTHRAT